MSILAYFQKSEDHKINSCSYNGEYDGDFPNVECQGAKEWSVLCPVSKLTGWPMSMQQAIFMITDRNERLANVLYEEIPSLQSMDNVTDDDKLRLLVSRLESGSFFENDNVVNQIAEVAKEFFPNADVSKAVENVKIDFKSDNDVVENV